MQVRLCWFAYNSLLIYLTGLYGVLFYDIYASISDSGCVRCVYKDSERVFT